MSTRKCQSRNPSKCRYHGSLEHHIQQHKLAHYAFMTRLDAVIAAGSLDGNSDISVLKLRRELEYAQATVDAHDENFENILQNIEKLEKYEAPTAKVLTDYWKSFLIDIYE